MNYHPNDAERAEQRAGKSYAVASIAIGIVVLVLAVMWVVQMTGFRPRPQDTIVAPPPAAVIISEPKVAKIQDRLEAQAPAPVPEAPAVELKPAVDLPPAAAAPAPEQSAPGWTCGPYGCTNDAAVAAEDKAQRAESAPVEETNRKPLRHRHPRHDSAVKEITPRNKDRQIRFERKSARQIRHMPTGLRRVLADGAGRAVGCQGDCSLPALICKASARGAGLIR